LSYDRVATAVVEVLLSTESRSEEALRVLDRVSGSTGASEDVVDAVISGMRLTHGVYLEAGRLIMRRTAGGSLSTNEYYRKWLRLLREYAGLSQQELADEIGATRGSIAHVESGRQSPSTELMERWCAATGASYRLEITPPPGFPEE
jgi:DNA-binding XRE family transcriptional regulator